MAILFASTSVSDFFTQDATAITTASNIAPGVAEGVRVNSSILATFAYPLLNTSLTEGWIQFFFDGPTSNNGVFLQLNQGSSGSIRFSDNGDVQSTSNGSSWTTLGTPISNTSKTAFFDLHFRLNATTGFIRLYRAKTLVYEFVGNTIFNSVTSIDQFRLTRTGFSANNFSAVIVADEDTRRLRYAQTLISTQGTYNEWTGPIGNVSGTDFNPETLITTNTPNARTTYNKATLNSIFNTGWTILAAAVTVRAATEAGRTANIRAISRSGTADGFSPEQSLQNTMGSHTLLVPVNPATGLAWTVATFNPAQLGVQARSIT